MLAFLSGAGLSTLIFGLILNNPWLIASGGFCFGLGGGARIMLAFTGRGRGVALSMADVRALQQAMAQEGGQPPETKPKEEPPSPRMGFKGPITA